MIPTDTTDKTTQAAPSSHSQRRRDPEASAAGHRLLERAKAGAVVSEDAITFALIATGDLGGWWRKEREEREREERERAAAGEAECRAVYGYLPPQAPRFDIHAIRSLRADGLSYSKIAERVGCSISTAHRWVTEQ